jgi:hypothetical protein
MYIFPINFPQVNVLVGLDMSIPRGAIYGLVKYLQCHITVLKDYNLTYVIYVTRFTVITLIHSM